MLLALALAGCGTLSDETAGRAMMGVSLAPITGQLANELLARERSAFDLGQLSPDRFFRA